MSEDYPGVPDADAAPEGNASISIWEAYQQRLIRSAAEKGATTPPPQQPSDLRPPPEHAGKPLHWLQHDGARPDVAESVGGGWAFTNGMWLSPRDAAQDPWHSSLRPSRWRRRAAMTQRIKTTLRGMKVMLCAVLMIGGGTAAALVGALGFGDWLDGNGSGWIPVDAALALLIVSAIFVHDVAGWFEKDAV